MLADLMSERGDQIPPHSSDTRETAMKVRCPDGPDTNGVHGCGRVFDAEPDEDGYVDCPHCGVFFDPSHPHSQPQP